MIETNESSISEVSSDLQSINWQDIPEKAWPALDDLRFQVILGKPYYQLKDSRWYGGFIHERAYKLSNHSYAKITIEPLIECGVLKLVHNDDSPMVILTDIGYATVTQDLPDNIVFRGVDQD